MGEDNGLSTSAHADKKANFNEITGMRNGDHSFPNSSTMSTCSEMDSETNSYVNEDVDQDYQYGPGIVSKLRTKFLTISLKQNRGSSVGMRRSCSLENILDQKTTAKSTHGFGISDRLGNNSSGIPNGTVSSSWSTLKRAKSMDTLLMHLEKEQNTSTPSQVVETEVDSSKPKEPKVIRRKDGPLNRSTITISDEEFPKPDTVKTYKRMFEPAESKKTNTNSNVRRRPPVLRATAKSGSNANLKPNLTNAKPNGVVPPKGAPISKSNHSAKVLKVASLENGTKTDLPEKEVKSKEVETLNKKNQQRNEDLILSGTVRAEAIQLRVKDEVAKRNQRVPKLPDNKPSIPLRKPSPLKSPPPKLVIAQAIEHKTNCVIKPTKEQTSAIKSTKDQTNVIKPAKEQTNVIKPAKEQTNVIKPTKEQTIVIEPTKEHTSVDKPILISNGNVKRPAKVEIKSKIETVEVTEEKKVLENGLTNGDKEMPFPVETKPIVNGIKRAEVLEDAKKPSSKETVDNGEVKVVKRVSSTPGGNNSMVFDFRGKDVVSHLSVSPAPFGCKGIIKRRNVLIDGKEIMPYLNGFVNGGEAESDEDDDFVDYSVPPPCGLVFDGENVIVGKGSILATRNKDLKIHFDDNVEQSTFVYPSESSLLTDDSSLTSTSSSEFSSLDSTTTETAKPCNGVTSSSAKLPSNTALNSTGGTVQIIAWPGCRRITKSNQHPFVALRREFKPKNRAFTNR